MATEHKAPRGDSPNSGSCGRLASACLLLFAAWTLSSVTLSTGNYGPIRAVAACLAVLGVLFLAEFVRHSRK